MSGKCFDVWNGIKFVAWEETENLISSYEFSLLMSSLRVNNEACN